MFYNRALSILEINLDALARNYLFLQKRLKNGCDMSAVVKADAYGLGAETVAQALHRQGCRHFFVAHAQEGIKIRAALGKEASVYILNGSFGTPAEEFVRNQLVPVLNTPQDITYWQDHARRVGQKQAVILHIDTGMNRLGLSGTEVNALADKSDAFQGLDVRYVMSHLACADEPQHPKNSAQLELFQTLSACFGKPFRYSFANSAGVMLGAEYQFDLVRPGCALYGINPQNAEPNPMQGVVSLKCIILQVRDITEAGTIGYGATYSVAAPAVTATISVGYADGYLRSLSGQGVVHIGGAACPVLGRVSMDTIVVDVSHLKIRPQIGDYAEIIGAHQSVDAVAKQAQTIGYEILTSLGGRYQRIYTGER